MNAGAPAGACGGPDGSDLEITVMITCFNEQAFIVDSIRATVAALSSSGRSWEVLVIDDASQDESARVIQDYIDAHPDEPVRLHRNPANRGLANNFVDGAFLGSGTYYRFCSGDNSEPSAALAGLLRYMGQADLIVPYQPSFAGRSRMRKILSWTFTFLVNGLSGYRLRYYNGSPIYLRYHVMRHPPATFGFGFQADLITRLLDLGCTYIQVPRLGLEEKKGGRSTAVSMRNLLSTVHSFVEIIFRRIKRRLYPQTFARPREIFVDRT